MGESCRGEPWLTEDSNADGSVALASPKSSTFTVPSGRTLTLGFQIAMDDALFMRGLQRVGDLFRDRQGFIEWNGAARESRRQVFTVDQLHHKRVTGRGGSRLIA